MEKVRLFITLIPQEGVPKQVAGEVMTAFVNEYYSGNNECIKRVSADVIQAEDSVFVGLVIYALSHTPTLEALNPPTEILVGVSPSAKKIRLTEYRKHPTSKIVPASLGCICLKPCPNDECNWNCRSNSHTTGENDNDELFNRRTIDRLKPYFTKHDWECLYDMTNCFHYAIRRYKNDRHGRSAKRRRRE